MTLVGVIADTHGLLRPEVRAEPAGCDATVHAGDIGRPGIVAELEAIAPLTIGGAGLDVRFVERGA